MDLRAYPNIAFRLLSKFISHLNEEERAVIFDAMTKDSSCLEQTVKGKIASSLPDEFFKLVSDLKVHTGRPDLLVKFCERFNTLNPYEAVKRAILLDARFKVKGSSIDEDIKDFCDVGDGEYVIKSESGHKLTGEYYIFANKESPSKPAFVSGPETIMKIFGTFGTDEQKRDIADTDHKTKSVYLKNKDILERPLEEIIDREQGFKQKGASFLVDYSLSVLELSKQIDSLRFALSSMAYANITIPNFHFLDGDVGGGMLTWYKRKISKDPKLIPKFERDIYVKVSSPLFFGLDDSTRRKYLSTLFEYYLLNQYVNSEVIFKQVKSDIELFNSLPKDNLLVKEFGYIDVAQVLNILSSPEISVYDYAKLNSLIKLKEIRLKFAKEYLEKYRKEVDVLLEKTKHLFIDDSGHWMKDSYKESVPLGRLKNTHYFLCFDRDDFFNIRNQHRLMTLTNSNEDDMLSVLPLTQSKSVIDSLVSAGRRLNRLEEYFKSQGITVSDNPDFVSQFRDRLDLPRGSNASVIENFGSEYGFDIDSAIERAKTLFDKKLFKTLTQYKKDGVFFSLDDSEVKKLKTVVHASEIHELLDELLKLFSNPLVINISPQYFDLNTRRFKEYYKPSEVNRLKNAAAFSDVLVNMGKRHGLDSQDLGTLSNATAELLSRLNARKDAINSSVYYSCSDTLVNCLTLREKPKIDERFVSGGLSTRFSLISYIDLDSYTSILEDYEKNYSLVSLLGENFLSKIIVLSNRNLSSIMSEHKPVLLTDEQLNRIKSKDCYIEKTFATKVDESYEKLRKNINDLILREKDTVVFNEDYLRGELYDSYLITIFGTCYSDVNDFRKELSSEFGFKWDKNKHVYNSTKTILKHLTVEFITRVKAYCVNHPKSKIRLEFTKQ